VWSSERHGAPKTSTALYAESASLHAGGAFRDRSYPTRLAVVEYVSPDGDPKAVVSRTAFDPG